MSKVISMNIVVSSAHVGVDMDENEFFDKFVDFLEANEWMFGGCSSVEEDDE